MNTYDILVTYAGEGKIDIVLPKAGTHAIYARKPIQILNAPASVVEYLRSLRPILIYHQLNKVDSSVANIIDYANLEPNSAKFLNQSKYDFRGVERNTVDRSSIRSERTGPIVIDKPAPIPVEEVKESIETTVDDIIVNNVEDDDTLAILTEDLAEDLTDNTTDLSTYVIPKGIHKGKTLKQCDEEGILVNVLRGQDKKTREIIEMYRSLKNDRSGN